MISNEIDPLKAETSRYSVLQDGTLMIENAQETDQGVYECMAKNSLGEVRSRKAKMKRQIRESMTFKVIIQSNYSIDWLNYFLLPCRLPGYKAITEYF